MNPNPKIAGMMMVRNEEWIVGLSLRAALMWCDCVIVLDHGSTDNTVEIVHEIGCEDENKGRVWLLKRYAGTWHEMAFRDEMLTAARAFAATHAAIIDADEILTANLVGEVRELVADTGPNDVLELPMIPAWRSLDHYRDDRSVWSRAQLSTAVGMSDRLRYMTRGSEGYDFHNRIPAGALNGGGRLCHPLNGLAGGGVIHAQFANWPRLLWKHTLYKMIEVLRWPGRESVAAVNAKYEVALDERGIALTEFPPEFLAEYRDRGWLDRVDLADEPWQRREAMRLLDEHGRDRFGGLRLRGIDADETDTATAKETAGVSRRLTDCTD